MEGQHEEEHQQRDGEGLPRCSCAHHPAGDHTDHSEDEGLEGGLPSMEITATEQANKFLLQSFKKSAVLEKFTGAGDYEAAANDDEWDTPQNDDDNDEPAEGAEVIRAEVEALSIQDGDAAESSTAQ
jgi:hypothetical protein